MTWPTRAPHAFLQAHVERSPVPQTAVDTTGRFTLVNDAFCALVGLRRDALIGRAPAEITDASDSGAADVELRAVTAGERASVVCERVLRHADGHPVPVLIQATSATDGHTGLGACAHVSDLRLLRNDLEAAWHRTVLNTTHDGVWVLDQDGRTEYLNAALSRILGVPAEQLRSAHPADSLGPQSGPLVRRRLRDRARRGREIYDLPYAHPDGSQRLLEVTAAPIALGGRQSGSVAIVSDVTRLRRAEAELRKAALHDNLTGLPNRSLLDDRLHQALLRRGPGTEVAVLLVDVDHLGRVNQAHGHVTGDAVVREAARRLAAVAGPEDTVARLGGDDFVVLVADVPGRAASLATAVIEAFRPPVTIGSSQLAVSVSIGLATASGDHGDLLRRADTALFVAKTSGRGRAHVWHPMLEEPHDGAGGLAAELATALTDGALEMHLQPIVDLSTGTIAAVEALARWPRDEGAVPPDVSVPLAEQAGLGIELDRWAVHRAITEVGRARRLGRLAPGVRVAVNLVARHVADPGLESQLMASVVAAGLRPHDVALEITEQSLLQDLAVARPALHRLAKHGFGIELDDFGTGYSSLSHLRDLPIDTLKIDRSFVADLSHDVNAQTIVGAVTGLARALGMTVIAEGVETQEQEQAQRLRRAGCHQGQGWLWSRAVPVSALNSLPDSYGPADPSA